ncbi:hypothetical protein RFI_21472 [Reticulomyxa filosa]|uniref:Uncharacterized protein n=1 Tax=Reticulomyxa filosa TaxID=46433 RepID=X6MR53_RETFI|nr:hypothetical protein RFI_21472 [Reticulomyxa filosa]|eukprot:ETO15892.1 hypothetical protein RFI_21472 [Reticulomyxa filosa]
MKKNKVKKIYKKNNKEKKKIVKYFFIFEDGCWTWISQKNKFEHLTSEMIVPVNDQSLNGHSYAFFERVGVQLDLEMVGNKWFQMQDLIKFLYKELQVENICGVRLNNLWSFVFAFFQSINRFVYMYMHIESLEQKKKENGTICAVYFTWAPAINNENGVVNVHQVKESLSIYEDDVSKTYEFDGNGICAWWIDIGNEMQLCQKRDICLGKWINRCVCIA